MSLRRQAHFQPRMPRQDLLADINDWMRKVSKDETCALDDDTRLTRSELTKLLYAINMARSHYVRQPDVMEMIRAYDL